MKKTIVAFLVLSLMMMLAMFAPAMAGPAEKLVVTADTYNQVNDYTNMREIITDDSIIHRWGIIRTGDVDLTIDGETIVGELYEVVDVVSNTKTNEVLTHFSPCVWSFVEGSFEGVKQAHFRRDPDGNVIFTQHVIFQGTGIFEGCTLMMERPPIGGGYVGIMLKR
jgi:hypothetical protein